MGGDDVKVRIWFDRYISRPPHGFETRQEWVDWMTHPDIQAVRNRARKPTQTNAELWS